MMAIGERIHFFRILRGMTQKYLGTIVGFPERSADVRLAVNVRYIEGMRGNIKCLCQCSSKFRLRFSCS